MYGVAAEQSIVTLFVAGALPGILLAIFLIVTVKIISYRRNYGAPETEARTVKTFLRNLWNAKWALLSPVIILGGIYSGFFTVTEASIISVLYGLFVSVFVYKKYSWAKFKDNIFYMSRMTGSVSDHPDVRYDIRKDSHPVSGASAGFDLSHRDDTQPCNADHHDQRAAAVHRNVDGKYHDDSHPHSVAAAGYGCCRDPSHSVRSHVRYSL